MARATRYREPRVQLGVRIREELHSRLAAFTSRRHYSKNEVAEWGLAILMDYLEEQGPSGYVRFSGLKLVDAATARHDFEAGFLNGFARGGPGEVDVAEVEAAWLKYQEGATT